LVACAGRRGGKTQAGAAEFVRRVLRDAADKLLGRRRWAGQPHPPWVRPAGKDPEAFLRYAVVAPTHALLDEPRIALRRYLGHVRDGAPGLIVSQGRDETGIWCAWIDGGIRVDFFSGERPELLVGRGYHGVWLEEAARIKPAVWRDNLRPALSDHSGWALFTTTPLGRNWFWEEIWARGNRASAAIVAKLRGTKAEDILDPEFTCAAWTTADNDAIPSLAEEMEIARRQMPAALWRRNYLADFDSFEGQLFDLGVSHLRAAPRGQSHPARLYVGFDAGNVGKTSHRSAIAILGQPVRGGGWHELHTDSSAELLPFGDDAWARRDKGDRSTWANRLYHALRAIVGDRWRTVPVYVPADRPDVRKIWESYGFAARGAYQKKGAQEAAIAWVQTALVSGRLVLSSEVLFTCMSGLHYPGPGESSKKAWVDKEDDEWDALRYALSEVLDTGVSPLGIPLGAMGWNRT